MLAKKKKKKLVVQEALDRTTAKAFPCLQLQVHVISLFRAKGLCMLSGDGLAKTAEHSLPAASLLRLVP